MVVAQHPDEKETRHWHQPSTKMASGWWAGTIVKGGTASSLAGATAAGMAERSGASNVPLNSGHRELQQLHNHSNNR